ncbi:MAG: OsmC family protein [Nitrospirae bacterium]|nr:OsmC family protein [Nitrospirota bacterium]
MSTSVETKKESMTVSWIGGVQLAVEVRNHRLILDQPVEEGGQDQGMTPVEIFIASLGGCVGYFAARFCRRHGIPTVGLTIAVEWDYAERPHRVGTITVHVDLPARLDSEMKNRLRQVLEGCTIHQSLTHPPRISVVLV